MARKTQIQIRRDTAANWTSGNPTLAAGELGLETDTGNVKAGDGSTAWTSLDYVNATVNSAAYAQLLARTVYEPGTQANYSTTETDNALADVDATNLAVTFTVPASGVVRVVLHGQGFVANASAAHYWGIREGTSKVGNFRIMGQNSTLLALTYMQYVTGLTPDASLTYKWAYKTANATYAANIQIGGTNRGAGIMEVWGVGS